MKPLEPLLPSAAKKNLEIIATVEQELLHKQSRVERLGRAVARFFGSAGFIVAHGFFLAGWVLLNAGAYPGFRPFDPYPFAFLSLVVGVEFILLTTFVLMNQKYEMRRTEQWAHLHLQLSMLTEQEVTKNMQMLGRVCRRLGLENLAADQELEELARPTSLTAFVGEIEKSLEAGGSSTEVADEAALVRKMEEQLVRQPIEEDGES